MHGLQAMTQEIAALCGVPAAGVPLPDPTQEAQPLLTKMTMMTWELISGLSSAPPTVRDGHIASGLTFPGGRNSQLLWLIPELHCSDLPLFQTALHLLQPEVFTAEEVAQHVMLCVRIATRGAERSWDRCPPSCENSSQPLRPPSQCS